MSAFQEQLQAVLADRHTAEARALFLRLMQYIDVRVVAVWRYTCKDLLDTGEREEVVSEVMEILLTGALARFRGETLSELFAFVRRVTDRCLIHRARRRLRQRRVLEDAGREGLDLLATRFPDPDQGITEVPDNPLAEADQDYLLSLLRAGSMAEHARRQAVSRAAVTLRVQRIRSRIESLAPVERAAVETWLENAAAQVARED